MTSISMQTPDTQDRQPPHFRAVATNDNIIQHRREPVSATAFSLIELLITISVIAVLTSLLLVVITQIRTAAKQVVCANNLRGLGVYAHAYAQDRQGIGAPSWYLWDKPWNKFPEDRYEHAFLVHADLWGGPWDHWTYYLLRQQADMENGLWDGPSYDPIDPKGHWDYVAKHAHQFQCPAAPVQFLKMTNNSTISVNRRDMLSSSYGMNTTYLGKNGQNDTRGNPREDIDGFPGFGVGIPGVQDHTRRYAKISRPGETILLAEHIGQADNGFSMHTDPPFVQTPRGTDGQPLPVPADFGSLPSPFNGPGWDTPRWALRASHHNQSNYLFHDGRVALLTPWQTCSKADYNQPNMWTGR